VLTARPEALRDFHRKVRRTEGEKLGGALPPAGPVLRCAPNGAASSQTFCSSDLPVKKNLDRHVVARNRYGSFCDSGCGLAAKDVMNPEC
jgi:hypothetical protein